MAGITLDAGPLVALDRGNEQARAWLRVATRKGTVLATPSTVIGETWRGGPRAANLSRALTAVEVIDLSDSLARQAGELLAATGSSATLDAFVVALAKARGDVVLTSDPDDIRPLAQAAGVEVREL